MQDRRVALWRVLCATCFAVASASAAPAVTHPTDGLGPYNATFLDGGVGMARPLTASAAPVTPRAPWSLSGWLFVARRQPAERIVAAVGDVAHDAWQGVLLQ